MAVEFVGIPESAMIYVALIVVMAIIPLVCFILLIRKKRSKSGKD